MSALEEQQLWTDRDASTKAHALLSCLERSDTLVGLACLNAIASVMKPLARALQRKDGDLVRALHLVDDTAGILHKMRSGDGSLTTLSFFGIFNETTSMAQRIGVTLQKPRVPAGKSVHRSAAAADGSVEDYYRINVFNAGIGAVLTDFTARYGMHVRLSAGLNCPLPNLMCQKSWDDVKIAYKKYSAYLPGTAFEVEAEFEIWKQHWEDNMERPHTSKVNT